MVAVSEVESTFWGLCLEGGKKYSQNVATSFHVSMAATDPLTSKTKEPITLYLEKDNVEYVLCSLLPGKLNQQLLDLNFNQGEDINLYIKEKGTLHLTGYLVDENRLEGFSEGEEEDEDEEEEEEEDEPVMQGNKRKLKALTSAAKKGKFEMTDDDDEEMVKVQVVENKDKKKKKDKQNGDKKVEPQTPVEGSLSEDKKKKKKKKKQKKDKEETSEVTKGVKTTPAKTLKTVKGGVVCEDVCEGNGAEAVNGKQVKVYYTGKLQSGKVFDSTMSGKPFSFKLGKKDVIPGWEVGIQGMKVGGKRKLTIPASMGYGNQKMGGIPANSTLVFDVELKGVH